MTGDKIFEWEKYLIIFLHDFSLFHLTAITHGKLARTLIGVTVLRFLLGVLREQINRDRGLWRRLYGMVGGNFFGWWQSAMVGGDGVLSRFSIDVVIIDWDYHRLWSPDQPNWAESDKHRHAWNIAIWRLSGLWLARASQPGLLIGRMNTEVQLFHGLAMNYFLLICDTWSRYWGCLVW